MSLRQFSVATAAVLWIAFAAPAASQESPSASKKLLLAEGTEVKLRMAQDISSRSARPGELIELALAEDLKVGDVVVAKAGARSLGEVVKARRPDFWGEAGEVSIRVHFLRVGDKKVEIRGAAGAAGTRYIIVRGSQAIIKAGTAVKGFVAADTDVVPVADRSSADK